MGKTKKLLKLIRQRIVGTTDTEKRRGDRLDLTPDAREGLRQIIVCLSRRDLIYFYIEIKKIIS